MHAMAFAQMRRPVCQRQLSFLLSLVSILTRDIHMGISSVRRVVELCGNGCTYHLTGLSFWFSEPTRRYRIPAVMSLTGGIRKI